MSMMKRLMINSLNRSSRRGQINFYGKDGDSRWITGYLVNVRTKAVTKGYILGSTFPKITHKNEILERPSHLTGVSTVTVKLHKRSVRQTTKANSFWIKIYKWNIDKAMETGLPTDRRLRKVSFLNQFSKKYNLWFQFFQITSYFKQRKI